MTGSKQATLIGLTAIALWSSIVGLIRGVSESFGATGGAALIYTVASALLMLTVGPTRVSQLPRRYLYVGGALFVAYELCLSLSLGYANNARQAIEVGMVNYLWPSFTLTAAILFNGQRTNALIVPGFLLGIIGVCWVLGGDQGLDAAEMLANVRSNPLSYGLAFFGAVIANRSTGRRPGVLHSGHHVGEHQLPTSIDFLAPRADGVLDKICATHRPSVSARRITGTCGHLHRPAPDANRRQVRERALAAWLELRIPIKSDVLVRGEQN